MQKAEWPWKRIYLEMEEKVGGAGYSRAPRVEAKIRERRGKTRTYRQLQYWHEGTCKSVGLGSVSNAVLDSAIARNGSENGEKHAPTEKKLAPARARARTAEPRHRTEKEA